MKKFFPVFRDRLKEFFSFKEINPQNHWKILLYLFFTIIIILVIFDFYFLYKIKNKQIFQVTAPPEVTPVLINEKLLNGVTESFKLKSIKEKEIKDGLKFYRDPSI